MNMRSMFPALWGRDDKMTGDLASLKRDFDAFFERMAGTLPHNLVDMPDIALMPDMDVHDNDKDLTLTLELPGVEDKDIKIEMSDGMIAISGEKRSESETKEQDGYRKERVFGTFRRQMALPFRGDPDTVSAEFKNGVLTITIPKPAEALAQTRRIAIGKPAKG